MTFRLKITARGLGEIRSAYEWYECQQPALGEEFLTTLDRQLEQIRERPK